VDSHRSPIFVNLSLLVLMLTTGPTARADEHAILLDKEPVPGRLRFDSSGDLIFQATENQTVLPVRVIRKVENPGRPKIAPGTLPALRLSLWGTESISGNVQSIEDDWVQLETPAGDRLRVPLFLISKIEHAHGAAVFLRDDFESDQPLRRLSGTAAIDRDRAATGRGSGRLAKPGDLIEYRLPQPVASGWLEARFLDSAQTEGKSTWFCELEFDSRMGMRTLRVTFGWDGECYGLESPQGPSLQVQRLSRREGWSRLGVRFSADTTSVLLDDAVLTHRDVGFGSLKTIRFGVRSGEEADPAELSGLTGYVDDLQVAADIATSVERQPTAEEDDVLLVNGDQLFGRIQSASPRDVTVEGDFGTQTLPWTGIKAIHFTQRPATTHGVSGQRARIRFTTSIGPGKGEVDSDTIDGAVRELTDEFFVLDHSHIGLVRIRRGQMREIQFFAAGHWLSIDPRFHHFGDEVHVRFEVPHPGGSDRSWNFSLREIPAQSALVLNVVGMAPMAPGSEFNKRLENDEWRTYAAINGQKLDLMGLNHRLPLNSRGPVRVTVPIDAGVLRKGENVLRIFQTPQQDDPGSFDDCGIFGIGLELQETPMTAEK